MIISFHLILIHYQMRSEFGRGVCDGMCILACLCGGFMVGLLSEGDGLMGRLIEVVLGRM